MTNSVALRVVRALTLIAAVVSLGSRPGAAQARECTYDRCALRAESKLLSTRLVRGRESILVSRLGIFPPRIPLFEQGPDSVRVHYLVFRSRQKVGAALAIASAAMSAIGLALIIDGGHSTGLTTAVGASGFALSVAGGFTLRSASNELAQSVWWYNRGLARAP